MATFFRSSRIFATCSAYPKLPGRAHSALRRCECGRWSSTTTSTLLPRLPILEAIASHDPKSTAIIHSVSQRSFTYGQLLQDVALAYGKYDAIDSTTGERNGLRGERMVFMVENSYDYVVTLLSIFACNAIAIPLAPGFESAEKCHILNDSQARILLASSRFQKLAIDSTSDGIENENLIVGTFDKRLERCVDLPDPQQLLRSEPEPETAQKQGGVMLYTSGTTSRPKGVFLSTPTLTAQVQSMSAAWSYASADHLLHLLPLNHIHGLVNAVLAPLFAGGTIEFYYPFNPTAILRRLASPLLPLPMHPSHRQITLLTAVPTMYNRLLSTHSSLPGILKDSASTALSPEILRLPMSGSSSLPLPTREAFKTISKGNSLLERYGMTETGMILSCGLSMENRIDGAVGWPLPGVDVRLVSTETSQPISADAVDEEGEVQVRGPTIFTGYWRNPTASSEAFVPSSSSDTNQAPWFRTGDIAVRRQSASTSEGPDVAWANGPCYYILGRNSIDIIKTGGEKVSALEIEREMLGLPEVKEVAVVGIKSERWGQKVGAVVVLDEAFSRELAHRDQRWGAMDVRRGLRGRLAGWKLPHVVEVVEGGLRRNAMGKVDKKRLLKDIFPENEEVQ